MRYTGDLTDAQWELIKEYFPAGNKRKYEKRELVNAVLYLVKTGCQWRNLPTDFPKWKAVSMFYYRAQKNGKWDKVQPIRWIVERTFCRMTWSRRLSKDYEIKAYNAETMCIISNILRCCIDFNLCGQVLSPPYN